MSSAAISSPQKYTQIQLSALQSQKVQKKARKSKSLKKRSKSMKTKNKLVQVTKENSQSQSQNHPHSERKKEDNNSTVTQSALSKKKEKVRGHLVEKQVKLKFFLKKSSNLNTNSSSFQSTNEKFAASEFQQKMQSLQSELQKKEELFQRLKGEREKQQEKYNQLRMSFEDTKMKNRKILEQKLRETAEINRFEKLQIKAEFGYYKKNNWLTFVEGSYITKEKQKILSIQQKLKNLEESRLSANTQEKQRLTYQIDYFKKRIAGLTDILKFKQQEVARYKENLRLAEKELQSTLAISQWPLLNNRYLPLQLLGSGGFGQVYKAYDLEKNQNVAIKINCFEPNTSPEVREEFLKHVQREVKTLKTLNHPNIAQIIEEIEVNDKFGFVMEFCTGPQLSKYLHRHGFLEQKEAKGIIKQLALALKYLYEQKERIIHYDLKPSNIIFHRGCVKVIDFGLCKKISSEDTKIDLTSQGVGTYWYLPPETFQQNAQISSKVDVWSVGVIFYELLYGKRPFGHGMNQARIFKERTILKAQKVEFPSDRKFRVSQEAKQFIRECLRYNVQERLDPLQLVQHYYLNFRK